MAVIRNEVIVSPSVDSISDASFFDSTTIEPGIYSLSASKTIDGFTSGLWTVICLATEDASSPACFSQIWIPANITSGLTTAQQAMYIRTVSGSSSTFGSFTTMVNKDYLENNTLVNKTSYPTELYIQSTQPSPQAGKTVVWIDTSS